MALAPNNPFNSQILVDANYIVSGTITAATPSMNLIQSSSFPATRYVVLSVAASALNSVSPAYTASVFVQDSADNSTFANVPAMGPLVILAGAPSVSSSAAASQTYQFPPTVRQYVRLNASFVSGSAGTSLTNMTGSISGTLQF